MTLRQLDVHNIRNIESASLVLAPQVNLIIGDNGSGKTSLLEAVYFLGSGRTFRSQSVDPLIRREATRCTVFGIIEHGRDGGPATRIGVERDRQGDRDIRINGESTPRASELARRLPCLVLGPQTAALVTGSPVERRRFLNWGVFHVEQSFGRLYEQMNRCLRQRNELLKRERATSAEIGSWSERLVTLAEQVDAQRRRWFEAFMGHVQRVSGALMEEKSFECRYYRGWDKDRSLGDILAEQFESDRRRGFTQAGPHRADIRIRIQGQPAANVGSRGEIKVLSWALVLAQGACFRESAPSTLTYLVDDLAAELDVRHRQRVCNLLNQPDTQVLVTGIERGPLELGWNAPKLFHVEHGRFHAEENTG